MIDSDVDLVMKQPSIVTGSDGTEVIPANTPPFRASTLSMCKSGKSST